MIQEFFWRILSIFSVMTCQSILLKNCFRVLVFFSSFFFIMLVDAKILDCMGSCMQKILQWKTESVKSYILGLPITIKRLPKCVRFTNFEQFWKAKVILLWSRFNHFFLKHCLEVASLIWSFAHFYITPKENIVYFKYFSFAVMC